MSFTERKLISALESRRGHSVIGIALGIVALSCGLVILAAAAAHAAESPTVFISPLADGQPPAQTPYGIPFAGTGDLDLWIETGPTATVSGPQILCANGLGDELCGWQLEIVATGGITIQGFMPDTSAVGPPIQSFQVSNTVLRINRVNAAPPAAGDFGPFRIGVLSVDVAGSGDIQIGGGSEVIGARLQRLTPLGSPIAVPEPSLLVGLTLGVLLLTWLAAAPCIRKSRSLLAWITVMIAAGPELASAQMYYDTDGTAFRNAVGVVTIYEQDFESWPLDGNGLAAVDNGVDFGGFTFKSDSISNPIPLLSESDETTPTGLTGTALVLDTPSANSVAVSPGSFATTGTPETNDDFTLEFDTPKAAVGLQILNNSVQAGETISFLDANGETVASRTLVGEAFIGFVSLPPSLPIKRIVVEESDVGGDDIYFDDVTWTDEVSLPDPPTWAPNPRLQKWSRISGDTPELAALQAGDGFGISVETLGDLNGDAVDDIVIGAVGDSVDGPSRGAAWVVFLERDGNVRSVRKISDSQGALSGPTNPGGLLADGAVFGLSSAALGNLDGDPDGTIDIAIGSPEFIAGTPGAVYILFMKTNGEVADVQRIDQDEGIVLGGGGGGLGSLISDDDWFGDGMALLGDLDRDGRPELAVGARNDDDGGTSTGSVFILSLNPNGTADVMRKISNADASLTAHLTLAADDHFGSAVEAVGDLDRDGVPDMAVGALEADTPAGPDRGAAHILFLNEDGSVKSVQTLEAPTALGPFAQFLWGTNDNARFGSGLGWIPTPGSDAEGILAVGIPLWDSIDPQSQAFYGRGAVELIGLDASGNRFGGGSIFRAPMGPGRYWAGQFSPTAGTSDEFGTRITSLGDLDQDGTPEILVGAFLADVAGETDVGAAYIVSLGGTDSSAFADAIAASDGLVFNTQAILGIPSSSSTTPIYQGGTVTVQFTDNVGRSDGTSAPDIRLYRPQFFLPPSQSNTLRISVSSNGAEFQTLQDLSFGKDETELDVDLDGDLGLVQDIRFVRLEVIVGCDPTGQPFPSIYCQTISGGSDPPYIAVELLNNASLVADFDFDGVVDALDNCRYFPNPLQVDFDDDGFGDFCDVCPEQSNPAQELICAPDQLQLEYLGINTSLTPDRHEWELSYRCGSSSATSAGAGFVVPQGIDPATAELGGGATPGPPLFPGGTCGNPPGNTGPPTDPGLGIGCGIADSTRLGDPSLINLASSGVLFPSQAEILGGLPNTLYFDFQAANQLSGWCDQVDDEIFLGLITTELGAVTDPIAHLTNIQSDLVGVPIVDNWTLTFRLGPDKPDLDIFLSPAVGEPAGAATRFDVCFRSDQTLNRLTFGVIGDPDDDSVGELRFTGCDNVTTMTPVPIRSCSGNLAPAVDAASSRTFGPFEIDGIDSLMVVQVEGNIPVGLPPQYVLNPNPTDLICIGSIETTATSSTGQPSVGVPPSELAAWNDLWSDAALRVVTGGSVVEVSATSAEWLVNESTNAPDDLDGDNIRDESDNCRFRYNPDQANSGGLLSDDPGAGPLGDSCECGDLNGTGRLYPSESGGASDLEILRNVVLGSETDPERVARCSLSEGPECTILDAVLLDAALGGNGVNALSAACSSAIPPIVTGP